MSEWEQLHRKAKQLEGRLEVRAVRSSALPLQQRLKRGRDQRSLRDLRFCFGWEMRGCRCCAVMRLHECWRCVVVGLHVLR